MTFEKFLLFNILIFSSFFLQISLFLYAGLSTFPSNVETFSIHRDGNLGKTTIKLNDGSEEHVFDSSHWSSQSMPTHISIGSRMRISFGPMHTHISMGPMTQKMTFRTNSESVEN